MNSKENKLETFLFLKTIRKFWKVKFQKIGLHGIVISVDYLLDYTSFWIQYLYRVDLYKNEQRSHCSLWWCLVVWNHNILQSLEMSLNHHHTWSICPSWNNNSYLITVLIMVKKEATYQLYNSKLIKLMTISWPSCTWISQLKSRLPS